MSDELEAIRATFGEMTEVYNDPIWPNGHATIATLLRLLDAAREELAEERAKVAGKPMLLDADERTTVRIFTPYAKDATT